MKVITKLFIGVAFLILASCNQPAGNSKDKTAVKSSESGNYAGKPVPSNSPGAGVVAGKPDQNMLVGEWKRTDGSYLLKIKSATADGKLDAGYFNPKPINVARAEWIVQNEKLVVGVELRDVNYPGSTYTLKYLSKDEKLVGNYFQAVEGVNYEVEFVRKN